MGRPHRRTVLMAALLLSACVSMPPERLERDRAVLAAIEPCREKYADLFGHGGLGVNQDGGLRYWYKDFLVAQTLPAEACFAAALKGVKVGPWVPARVAKAGPAELAIVTAPRVLVPVRINGVPGNLMLAPKSGLTSVRHAFAERAGLRPGSEAPSVYVQFAGAQKPVALPFVRTRTLEIGDASIEALDVVVHDNLNIGNADGVLGANVLDQFRVNVDQRRGRLRLAPKPQ